MTAAATLEMQLPPAIMQRFTILFGEGVGIPARTGTPLMVFLCDQLGIDREYIDRRVQTIFVNGRTVDRVEEIVLGDGDVIALSAAMPGLAGATLRKGGILAGFRRAISHAGSAEGTGAGRPTVLTLKLFNLVARETAARLLESGIWVKGPRLADFFKQYAGSFQAAGTTVYWNGRPLSTDDWSGLTWPADWVAVRATVTA